MKLPKIKLPKIRLPCLKIKSETTQELAMLAGFFMCLKGLYDIYPPVMWIIGGAWLMMPGRKV